MSDKLGMTDEELERKRKTEGEIIKAFRDAGAIQRHPHNPTPQEESGETENPRCYHFGKRGEVGRVFRRSFTSGGQV